MDISTIEITSKKVRGKNVDISTSEISSKNVHGNNVDVLTGEITSKKVRGKSVDIWTNEILAKRSMWKQHGFFNHRIFIEKICGNVVKIVIWSSKYRRNMDIESTSIRCGVRSSVCLTSCVYRSSPIRKNLF